MSYRKVEILRNRAVRMLDSAKKNLHDGSYDIATFMADQAVQLYLKSVVLELTGEIPRIHAVRQLLQVLKTPLNKTDEVNQFVSKDRSLLIRLEDSYINSRYIPREYDAEESEELVNFAKEVIDFVKSLRGEA